jgi:hypothetical protein
MNNRRMLEAADQTIEMLKPAAAPFLTGVFAADAASGLFSKAAAQNGVKGVAKQALHTTSLGAGLLLGGYSAHTLFQTGKSLWRERSEPSVNLASSPSLKK